MRGFLADINILVCVFVCVFVPVLLTQCNVIDRAPSIHSLIIDEYKERWDLSPVTVQLKHANEERLLYLWLYISSLVTAQLYKSHPGTNKL